MYAPSLPNIELYFFHKWENVLFSLFLFIKIRENGKALFCKWEEVLTATWVGEGTTKRERKKERKETLPKRIRYARFFWEIAGSVAP